MYITCPIRERATNNLVLLRRTVGMGFRKNTFSQRMSVAVCRVVHEYVAGPTLKLVLKHGRASLERGMIYNVHLQSDIGEARADGAEEWHERLPSSGQSSLNLFPEFQAEF